jgi:hypothetical protein
MKIKYVGPRPIISEHGISFKEGKEDKYIYLKMAVAILQNIDDKTPPSNDTLSDADIVKIMLTYEPNIEKAVEAEKERYQAHIQDEIEHVKQRTTLSDIDKEVFIKNYEIMKDYRIQRAINKIFYMHAVHAIAGIIKRDKIQEIDVSFCEQNWHILQTIQGDMSSLKSSIRTKLEVEPNEDGKLLVKLLVEGYSAK